MTKVPNFCEISNIDTSKNGFPIFDLMQSVAKGFVGSTYTVFYTEDENLLSEFLDICDKYSNDMPHVKAWLEQHLENVMPLSDIREKIGTMQNSLEYSQLVRSPGYHIRRQNACFAHYVDDDACYVFPLRAALPHLRSISLNSQSTDEEVISALVQMHGILQELHQQGVLEPSNVYKGLALSRILAQREKMGCLDLPGFSSLVRSMLRTKKEFPALNLTVTSEGVSVSLGSLNIQVSKEPEGIWTAAASNGVFSSECYTQVINWINQTLCLYQHFNILKKLNAV